MKHVFLEHTLDVLTGLEGYEEVMKSNIAITNREIISEAFMIHLTPLLGRRSAKPLIYDLCREAKITSEPLVDVLDETKEIRLSRAELGRLYNPAACYLDLGVAMT